jgi:hypothetical protein
MPIRDHAALGGRKRAESLTPERRSEIARRAAHRRWLRKRQSDQKPEHLHDTADGASVNATSPEPTAETRYTGAQQPEPPTLVNRASIPLSPREKAAATGVPFWDHAGYRDPYEVWLAKERRRGWASAV